MECKGIRTKSKTMKNQMNSLSMAVTDSEKEARRVIETYTSFYSLNKPVDAQPDLNNGLLAVLNFPHVRIATGNTTIINSPKEWRGEPSPLEPHFHHLSLDSVDFIQSSADKVHAVLTVSRYRADGEIGRASCRERVCVPV